LLVATAAYAQDTRNVTEPVIPPSCFVLSAKLSAIDGKTAAAPIPGPRPLAPGPVSLAEADEDKLDTGRIQKAIDGCPKGQTVELKADGAHDAFLSGPLDLRAGVTLRVDARTILFGSRDARVYEVSPGSCGTVTQKGGGCRALINGSDVAGAAVMGDGIIDGRGWAKVVGKDVSWWDLAEQARAGGSQNCPRLIVLSRSDNFTLYRITLKNSGNFHVAYNGGNGFTVWGVIVNTPGKGARNTDGIDPVGSTNVTITHCYISTGDDNVAIKAGAHCSHMTIAHNHFYAGHGMSIGSETSGGADSIRVTDLSIDGADNGIRIKSNSSKGGLVRDVVYRDVCIRNTSNPILMDSDYEHFGKGGDRLPMFTGIELHDVWVEGGGTVTLQGFDEKHRLGMTFDNVHFAALADTKIVAGHADLEFGPGPVSFLGEDISLAGAAGQASPNACQDKFVPMPQ
jgi:polygalacturonase